MLINPGGIKAAIDELPLNRAAMFSLSLVSLIFGAVMVTTHQLWNNTSEVVVTLIGWAALIKGFVYLASPHSIDHFKPLFNDPSKIRIIGTLCLVLGAWMIAMALGLL